MKPHKFILVFAMTEVGAEREGRSFRASSFGRNVSFIPSFLRAEISIILCGYT
jgi:hypothetical protein